MNQYFTLFKSLLRMRFKRYEKTSKRMLAFVIISLAIVYAMMMWMVLTQLAMLTPLIVEAGMIEKMIFVLVGVSAFITIIAGLVSMLSYIYFNKDAQFLASLPIKPSTIYFAKLSIVIIDEMILSTLFLLPALITVGIVAKLSVGFYFGILLLIILAPALPSLVSSIIAIPLMYIVSFFRNKGALTTIVLILIFAIFFGGYYYAVANFSFGAIENIDDYSEAIKAFFASLVVLEYILFPIKCLSDLVVGVPFAGMQPVPGALINLVLGLVVSAILVVFTLLISSKIYYRGVMLQIESSGGKSKGVKYSASSKALISLLRREWRDLTRNSTFGFQCLAGIVLVPIMVFFIHFMGNQSTVDMGVAEAEALAGTMGVMSLWMLLAMGIGMNICAATAITREGKNLLLTKSLPVSFKDIITAKLILSYAISVVTLLITGITYAIIAELSAIDVILMMAFLLVYSYAFTAFCIWRDMSKPKLDWTSAYDAIKRNMRASMPMLINMLITMPMAVILIVCTMFGRAYLGWGSLLLISILLAYLAHNRLMQDIEPKMSVLCP